MSLFVTGHARILDAALERLFLEPKVVRLIQLLLSLQGFRSGLNNNRHLYSDCMASSGIKKKPSKRGDQGAAM